MVIMSLELSKLSSYKYHERISNLDMFKVNFHLLNTGRRGDCKSPVSLNIIHPFH